jgi:fucose permease
MFSLLLAIIYMAFISLGLPDSLLGAAWPVMQPELGVPISYMGIISMIIALGTIASSLMSDRLNNKLGTGLVTAISVFLTAAALFGFSASHSFVALCIIAIPYGLGAGAVDAALNNYVALHYASRHMSWLHCFWGVGAAISPYIMSYCLSSGRGWNMGYRSVSIIQIILTILLFATLPLWKKNDQTSDVPSGEKRKPKRLKDVLKINGVKLMLFAFFGYCAMETTTGLWASSYLVMSRGIDAETAARYASLFYLGITFGRFLCGFIADKLGDRKLIRIGMAVILTGIVCVCLPLSIKTVALAGLIIIGFGCAPIYPSIIHSTPANFGAENSQSVIGIQMASAYTGSTFMPPLFGLIANHISISLFPEFLLIFAVLMAVMTELLNKKIQVD